MVYVSFQNKTDRENAEIFIFFSNRKIDLLPNKLAKHRDNKSICNRNSVTIYQLVVRYAGCSVDLNN